MESKKIKINLASFDLAKGIAILLVILSHTYGHYDLTRSKVLGAMPVFLGVMGTSILTAFFIISGFGVKENNPKKVLKTSFSNLIVPYLWITAAYAVILPLVRYPFFGSWSIVLDQAARYVAAFLLGYAQYGKVIGGYQIFWCTAAWFLLATFIALNVLNLILKIKNKAVQFACVVLCAIVGNLLFSLEVFYFCIPQGLRAVGYLYVGYTIKEYGIFRRMQANVWTYLCVIPVYLLEIKWITLDNTVFSNVTLEYIGSACSAMLFILLSVYLGEFEWKCLDGLKQIGIYSYWIICIHSFEMDAIPWYLLSQAMPEHQLCAFMIEILLKALIITAMCFLLKKASMYSYRRKVKKYGKMQLY